MKHLWFLLICSFVCTGCVTTSRYQADVANSYKQGYHRGYEEGESIGFRFGKLYQLLDTIGKMYGEKQ